MNGHIAVSAVVLGSWVRFWRNGRLEIGVVQYPPHEGQVSDEWLIDTDKGRTSLRDIVEVR